MNENASGSAVSLQAGRVAGRLRLAIRLLIAAVIFLVPLASLPFTDDPRFIKLTLVEAAAVLALALFALSAFMERRISYCWSMFHVGLAAFGAVLLISTLFSVNPVGSFWGPDPTGETAAFLLAVAVLAGIASAVFGEVRSRRLLTAALLGGFSLLALEFLVSVFLGKVVSLPAVFGNPIGTGKALALMIAAGFAMGVGMSIPSAEARDRMDRVLRWLAPISAGLSFAALLFLNYWEAWLAVALVSALYLALAVAKSYPRDVFSGTVASLPALGAAFAAVIIGLFFVFMPTAPFRSFYDPPAELAPSFSQTLKIAGKVLASGRLAGSGPGTFLADYNRFRDPAVNATPLWTVRFSHGSSLAATLGATLGLVGIAVFLGMLAVALILSLRRFLSAPAPPMVWGLLGFFAVLVFFALSSPSTAVSQFFLLLSPGLLAAFFSPSAEFLRPGAAPEVLTSRPWWDPRHWPRPRFGSPWIVRSETRSIHGVGGTFVVSLVAVFFAAFALVALWGLVMQYAGEAAYARGVRAFNTAGDLDGAEAAFLRARTRHGLEDRYDAALVQVAIARLRGIIGEAAGGATPELQERFRAALALGSGATERAAARNPADPRHWIIRGQLFEMVMPFITGADQAALEAYRSARQADPIDPSIPFVEARVRLTAADLLTLRINQTASGEERGRLETERLMLWDEAGEALEESLGLKPDYAQAHFLLAQIAIRRDDLAEAIRKTEETARLAPADVGVAFQLGVLYYRAGELDRARAEFERAILFNENYSNARYFLGLIWDRKGDRDAALSQFQKIEALNPGNGEVRGIIQNLRTGRRALEGIAPPAQAPEERQEVPVQESRQ